MPTLPPRQCTPRDGPHTSVQFDRHTNAHLVHRMPRIIDQPHLGFVGIVMMSGITIQELIFRSAATRPTLAKSNRPNAARCAPSRKSAACITATCAPFGAASRLHDRPHAEGKAARRSVKTGPPSPFLHQRRRFFLSLAETNLAKSTLLGIAIPLRRGFREGQPRMRFSGTTRPFFLLAKMVPPIF